MDSWEVFYPELPGLSIEINHRPGSRKGRVEIWQVGNPRQNGILSNI